MDLNIYSFTIVQNSITVHSMNLTNSNVLSCLSNWMINTVLFSFNTSGMHVNCVHIRRITDQAWRITFSYILMKNPTSKHLWSFVEVCWHNYSWLTVWKMVHGHFVRPVQMVNRNIRSQLFFHFHRQKERLNKEKTLFINDFFDLFLSEYTEKIRTNLRKARDNEIRIFQLDFRFCWKQRCLIVLKQWKSWWISLPKENHLSSDNGLELIELLILNRWIWLKWINPCFIEKSTFIVFLLDVDTVGKKFILVMLQPIILNINTPEWQEILFRTRLM